MSVEQDPEIKALRENIEETRQRIANEVEAIGDRFTPEHAKEVAKEAIVEAKDKMVESVKNTAHNVADKVTQTAHDVADRVSQSAHSVGVIARDVPGRMGDTIRANPIPVALVCVGAGWLLWQAVRSSRTNARMVSGYRVNELGSGENYGQYSGSNVSTEYGYGSAGEYGTAGGYGTTGSYTGSGSLSETGGSSRIRHAGERVRDVAQHARSRVNEVAGTARDRVGSAVHTVRERGGQIAVRGREVSVQAWHRSEDAYVSNPLAFGAVAVLAGVGVGMLIPSTAPENRLLGERRQQVLDRAKDVAREAKDVAMSSARDGVREGLRAAKETAKSEAETHNLPNISR